MYVITVFMTFKKYTALFFIVLFMSIISAPTLLLSMEKSVDTSVFFDNNEEEEKEDMKIVFEILSQNFDTV